MWDHELGRKISDEDNAMEFIYMLEAKRMSESSEYKELEEKDWQGPEPWDLSPFEDQLGMIQRWKSQSEGRKTQEG